jgi:hypothetical protein
VYTAKYTPKYAIGQRNTRIQEIHSGGINMGMRVEGEPPYPTTKEELDV